MSKVFLSYSINDHYFAELASIKLDEAGIELWRDRGHLRPGEEWRGGIEQGISDSLAVLVALSTSSSESAYVTYEWAYAFGRSKPIIPLKLTECKIHPKLEPIQYLDFSVPGALPWQSLVQRIQEIEGEGDDEPPASPVDVTDPNAKAILAYLEQKGFQMVSFERIRQRINPKLTDDKLQSLITRNDTLFRPAKLRGGKPGLARLDG